MKTNPMAKAVTLLLALAVVACAAVGVYIYRTGAPMRVWVEYSEKLQDRDPRRTEDYEIVEEDRALFAEAPRVVDGFE